MKIRQLFLVLTLLAFGAAAGGRPADRPNFTGAWRILQSRDASTTLVVLHRGARFEVTRKSFGDTLVIETDETREEWRLSEDGKELIVTSGTAKQTYRKFSERIDQD